MDCLDEDSNSEVEIDEGEIHAWNFIMQSAFKRSPNIASCNVFNDHNSLINVTHALRKEHTILSNILKLLNKGHVYQRIKDDRNYSLKEAQAIGWENHRYLIRDLLKIMQQSMIGSSVIEQQQQVHIGNFTLQQQQQQQEPYNVALRNNPWTSFV